MGKSARSPARRGQSKETRVAYHVGYVGDNFCPTPLNSSPQDKNSISNQFDQVSVHIWAAFLSASLVILAAGSAPVMAPITMFQDEQEKGLPR